LVEKSAKGRCYQVSEEVPQFILVGTEDDIKERVYDLGAVKFSATLRQQNIIHKVTSS
jgi:hypothetical protein